MRSILIVFACVLLFTADGLLAQSVNKVINDPQTEQQILIGYADRNGLTKGEFSHYYNSQYELYNVSDKLVKKISSRIENVSVTIVLGTWCIDSKIQVPRFMKIMDALAFPSEKIKMIALDTRKEAMVIDMGPFAIERVPTFIFYRDGIEIGRIIESPRKKLEKDILKILR
jgi:thiol-disulfide isomerase/thioredoxin